MRKLISVVTTFIFQMAIYLFVDDCLGPMLNKLFRSASYILILYFLLGVFPILIFIVCNKFFCKKDTDWKVKNIIYTNILFFASNLIYYLFLIGDDDFWGIGFTMHSFWLFVVSIALMVYYFSKGNEDTENSKLKMADTFMCSDES